MMTLDDYRKQFKRNLMIMRAAGAAPDASAGSTEDAENRVYENTDHAIVFLFDNRGRGFKSVKELEELVLETREDHKQRDRHGEQTFQKRSRQHRVQLREEQGHPGLLGMVHEQPLLDAQSAIF